jgi:hypothetical protein
MARFLATSGRKNLSVEIHSAAKPAYDFFHSQSMRFDKIELGRKCVDQLCSSNIYLATSPSKNKLLLVSGFEIIGFSLVHLNLNELTIVINNDLTDDDIEARAWCAALRTMLSSVNCHQLEPLRKQLNHSIISPGLMTKIFKSTGLTQEQLSRISGLSVSGLKKQRTKSSEPLPYVEDETEFEIFQKLKTEMHKEDISG